MRNGAFDQGHGFVHIKRLGQVFEGTGLVAGHRAVQVGVGGHDDNGQVRVLFHDRGQQGNAVYAGRADVADVGIRLFVLEAHHDAFTAGEHAGVQTGLCKDTVQYPADAFVVVYDPDVSRSAHWLSSRGRKMMKSVLPGSLSHSTSPRCWPMMLWVMESPRPVPDARPLIMG